MTDCHPLRSDAEQRRRHILEVAYVVFAEQGLEVPMDKIARAAEVGVGTLYRRFPDRPTLVVAAMDDHLTELVRVARRSLAEAPTAWAALVEMLGHSTQILTMRPQLALHPALAEAVHSDAGIRAHQRELLDLLGRIVAAAQEEGSLRPDVDVADVALLVGALRRSALPGGKDAAGASARLRALVLDALATGPRPPLPGDPLGPQVLGLTTAD